MSSREKTLRLIAQGSVYRQGMSRQKEPRSQSQDTWVLVLALGMTLEKSLPLSGLQFPHLSDEGRK